MWLWINSNIEIFPSVTKMWPKNHHDSLGWTGLLVALYKLLNKSDVCQDDIDSGDPGPKIVVTSRSNVTDLVTLTACKGHDRNVKTIILQRQMGPMTKYVRPNTGRGLPGSSSHCVIFTLRLVVEVVELELEEVEVMGKWEVLFLARGHCWM